MRVKPAKLAGWLVGFANAEGGTFSLGFTMGPSKGSMVPGRKQRNDCVNRRYSLAARINSGCPTRGHWMTAVVPLLKLTFVAKHRDRVLAVTSVTN